MFDVVAPKNRIRGPIAGLVLGALGFAFFLYCYYTSYFKWRDCFNEEGRCYDPVDMVVYTTSGFVWGCISVPFLLVAVISLFVLWRRRHAQDPCDAS